MFWWSRMRSSILKKCWIPFWHGFESHNVNDVQWLLNFWICLKTDSRPPRSSKPHSYTFPITSLPTIWSHVPNVCLETTAAIECLIAIPGLHACSILLTLHCSNAPSSLSPAPVQPITHSIECSGPRAAIWALFTPFSEYTDCSQPRPRLGQWAFNRHAFLLRLLAAAKEEESVTAELIVEAVVTIAAHAAVNGSHQDVWGSWSRWPLMSAHCSALCYLCSAKWKWYH